MQHNMELRMFRNEIEEDARGWSVSLFKLRNKAAFERSAEKGILHFS